MIAPAKLEGAWNRASLYCFPDSVILNAHCAYQSLKTNWDYYVEKCEAGLLTKSVF